MVNQFHQEEKKRKQLFSTESDQDTWGGFMRRPRTCSVTLSGMTCTKALVVYELCA